MTSPPLVRATGDRRVERDSSTRVRGAHASLGMTGASFHVSRVKLKTNRRSFAAENAAQNDTAWEGGQDARECRQEVGSVQPSFDGAPSQRLGSRNSFAGLADPALPRWATALARSRLAHSTRFAGCCIGLHSREVVNPSRISDAKWGLVPRGALFCFKRRELFQRKGFLGLRSRCSRFAPNDRGALGRG
jgi:hypothetical protein